MAMYGIGNSPSPEPMLMMRPAPWRRMWGTTARVIRTVPKKLVSNSALVCAIELSSSPARPTPKPALFTSTSMRPARRRTSPTAASIDASSVTSSASMANGDAPALAPRRLVPKTVNPSWASRVATARPMPDDAPVTSATLVSMVCPLE
jgi:hypothetical protein